MSIKNLIFDFDGTLIPSNKIKENIFFDIFSVYNVRIEQITQLLINPSKNKSRYSIIYHFLKEIDKLNDYSRLVSEYDQLSETALSNINEYEGVTSTLEMIHKHGFNMFISSATPQNQLVRICRRRNIYHLFNKIYGSADKEGTLLEIMALYKCLPNSMLVIGDSLDDYNSAVELDINFIPVNDFNERVGDLALSQEHIYSIPDIIPLLVEQGIAT